MPYYMPETPGLSALAGAAATFLQAKQQIAEDAIQKQYMQQQMQQAAALAPLTLAKTQADIDETRANTAYETMLTQPMDPKLETMLDKGAQMPSAPFVDPRLPIASQIAAQHTNYLQLQKHLTGLNHQLAMLQRQTPSPNIKDAMDSVKTEISETKAALQDVQTGMRDLTIFGAQGQKPITPAEAVGIGQRQEGLGLEAQRTGAYVKSVNQSATNKGPADKSQIDWANKKMEDAYNRGQDPRQAGAAAANTAREHGASQKTIDAINEQKESWGNRYQDDVNQGTGPVNGQSGSGGAMTPGTPQASPRPLGPGG